MSDQIKQIAERLRGLRDVLELTSQEVAESCQLTVEEYLGMESGEKDISVSALQKIARKYGIALDVLMFGEELNECLLPDSLWHRGIGGTYQSIQI